jgi:hypothetical protein
VRTILLCLSLAGCGMLGGGRSGRGRGREAATASPAHLAELTLASRCPHTIDVCYGEKEECLTLNGSAPQKVHVRRGGLGDVLVTIKGSSTSVFADGAFSMVEVDESCAHLYRRLAPAPKD